MYKIVIVIKDVHDDVQEGRSVTGPRRHDVAGPAPGSQEGPGTHTVGILCIRTAMKILVKYSRGIGS